MGSRGYGVIAVVLASWLAACAGHGARPEPFPAPGPARPPAEAESTVRAGSAAETLAAAPGPIVVQTALSALGRPYALGGNGPERFDCSGLVKYAYAALGVDLPRTVEEQFEASAPVPPDTVSAGDLVFFRISGSKPSHVGIALGDGSFVHAPSERGRVRVERLDAPYWAERFKGARRVVAMLSRSNREGREDGVDH